MPATVARLSDHTPQGRTRASGPVSSPDPSPSSWLSAADTDAIRAVSWAAAITGLAAMESRPVAVIQGAGRS